jgi:hypothetical protein
MVQGFNHPYEHYIEDYLLSIKEASADTSVSRKLFLYTLDFGIMKSCICWSSPERERD